jgi:hypothetical protein
MVPDIYLLIWSLIGGQMLFSFNPDLTVGMLGSAYSFPIRFSCFLPNCCTQYRCVLSTRFFLL